MTYVTVSWWRTLLETCFSVLLCPDFLTACLQTCDPPQIYFSAVEHRNTSTSLSGWNLSRILTLITYRNQTLQSTGRCFFHLFWEFRKQISARRTSVLPENFSGFPPCVQAVAAFTYFPSSFFIIVPIIFASDFVRQRISGKYTEGFRWFCKNILIEMCHIGYLYNRFNVHNTGTAGQPEYKEKNIH